MGLDGKGHRLVARRVEMNTDAALPPAQLSLFKDRLQMSFGSTEVSTLAEDVTLRAVEKYLGAGHQDMALPLLQEMTASSPTAHLQVRLARVYEQLAMNDKALEIWPLLTDTAKAGFYSGYAQLEILRAQALEALAGGDPDVSTAAMDLLSASSLALEPAELLAVKRAELSLQALPDRTGPTGSSMCSAAAWPPPPGRT